MGSSCENNTGWSITRNEEFEEDEVWGDDTFNQIKENDSNGYKTESSSVYTLTKDKIIPKSNNREINSMDQSQGIKQSSSTPNWALINGKKASKTNVSWSRSNNGGNDDDDEDDGNGSMVVVVPPHEWIARKIARSGVPSFSVHEGMGRTLKGRDLSNVRNAVLTKTGFIESFLH